MESRGCSVRLKKSPTFAQITVFAQLPQIPHFIASTKPFRNYVIHMHLAFCLTTQLATPITL
jgi:hypothetical protein